MSGVLKVVGFRVDCEDLGGDRLGGPGIWVDVVARAMEVMQEREV